MQYVVLNNGIKMPILGLGTVSLPKERMEFVIGSAYDAGYRLFDMAWHYYNEAEIGNAFKSLSIPREDLFLTNKLHTENLYWGGKLRKYDIPKRSVRRAFENSCKKLKTDYLDLYLMHWPFRRFEHLWEEMIKLYEAGRIRSLGVCSFEPEHLEDLKQFGVKPAVNQFEISPFTTRKNLIGYCQREGIQVEAFSAFGVGRYYVGVPDIMGNPVLKNIGDGCRKTVAQVVLRWLIQQDVVAIPRSKNPARQKENIDVFDFALSEEEMKSIDALNCDKFVYTNPRKTLISK